jgi:hypothetical protein
MRITFLTNATHTWCSLVVLLSSSSVALTGTPMLSYWRHAPSVLSPNVRGSLVIGRQHGAAIGIIPKSFTKTSSTRRVEEEKSDDEVDGDDVKKLPEQQQPQRWVCYAGGISAQSAVTSSVTAISMNDNATEVNLHDLTIPRTFAPSCCIHDTWFVAGSFPPIFLPAFPPLVNCRTSLSLLIYFGPYYYDCKAATRENIY